MKLRKLRNVTLKTDPTSVGKCKFCHRRHSGWSRTGKNAGNGCKTYTKRQYNLPTGMRTICSVVPPAVRKAVSAQATAKRLGTAPTRSTRARSKG